MWEQTQLPSSIHKLGSKMSVDTIPDWSFPYDTQAHIIACAANVCLDQLVPKASKVYPPKQFFYLLTPYRMKSRRAI